MKLLLTLIFTFGLQVSFAQKNNCDSGINLSEIISLDTIHFSNHAKLYRLFNCDSSWLTFETRKGKKQIIFTLEYPLVEYTDRLGYIYATEYKSTFLIQNNVISGCCDPPEFILFDKENGKIKSRLGRIIYYSDDGLNPYIIFITNSNYDSIAFRDYNSITILNVNNNKSYKIQLPKGRIDKTLQITGEQFPEHLFDPAEISNGFIKIPYRYKKACQGDKWFTGKISFNLKK